MCLDEGDGWLSCGSSTISLEAWTADPSRCSWRWNFNPTTATTIGKVTPQKHTLFHALRRSRKTSSNLNCTSNPSNPNHVQLRPHLHRHNRPRRRGQSLPPPTPPPPTTPIHPHTPRRPPPNPRAKQQKTSLNRTLQRPRHLHHRANPPRQQKTLPRLPRDPRFPRFRAGRQSGVGG